MSSRTALVMFIGTVVLISLLAAYAFVRDPEPWVRPLLSALIGFAGAFVLFAFLLNLFFKAPWDDRERRMSILTAQNEVYRQVFDVTRKVADASSSATTIERGLQASVESLRDELKLDGCSLRLYDKETEELESIAGCGYRSKGVAPTPLSARKGIAGKAIQERRAIFAANPDEAKEFVKPGTNGAPLKSLFCYPLIEHGEVVGILSGSCTQPRDFTPHERDVLELLAARLGSLLLNFASSRSKQA